jgi:hypothetical protein
MIVTLLQLRVRIVCSGNVPFFSLCTCAIISGAAGRDESRATTRQQQSRNKSHAAEQPDAETTSESSFLKHTRFLLD